MFIWKLIPLVLMCTFYQKTNAAEFESSCKRQLEPPSFKIRAENSKVVYDFSKSYKELTELSNSKNTTVGLASASLKVEANFNVQEKRAKKESCISPQVDILLTVSPQKIFVAKEFYDNVCIFNEISQHELIHVKINQQEAEALAKDLNNLFTRTFPREILVGVSSLQWKNEFNAYLKTKLFPKIQELFETRTKQKHLILDSPQEYERISTACNGVVAEIMN